MNRVLKLIYSSLLQLVINLGLMIAQRKKVMMIKITLTVSPILLIMWSVLEKLVRIAKRASIAEHTATVTTGIIRTQSKIGITAVVPHTHATAMGRHTDGAMQGLTPIATGVTAKKHPTFPTFPRFVVR